MQIELDPRYRYNGTPLPTETIHSRRFQKAVAPSLGPAGIVVGYGLEYYRQLGKEHPSIAVMASMLGMSSDLFRDTVKKLQAAGFVTITDPGFVYLFESAHGYKIGKSKNVEARLRSLTFPFEVTIRHRIFTRNYSSLERYFHRRFAEKRIRAEWFDLSESDVQEFCTFTPSEGVSE